MFKDRTFWICCGLVAATVAAYWAVGSADFIVFDDREYVYENPHLRDGLSWDSVTWALTTEWQANWHPLTWWSLMLDVQLFGLSSRAMHLVNLALHAGSSIVLLLALRRMTGSVWRSGMVAALFALHPLHVESVAWVAERKDVLSTFLGMLALWAYAAYAQRPGGLRYALVFVLLGLGLMAKPMLVTLPFVFLLLDYWPLGRSGERGAGAKGRRGEGEKGRGLKAGRSAAIAFMWLIVEKLPLLALAAVSCGITWHAAQGGGAVRPLEQWTIGARLCNAGVAYVAYIVKMLWPADLSVFYPLPDEPPFLLGLGAWTLLAGVSVGAVMAARWGRKYLAVGWFWYLGTLVPAIGLVQVGEQSMADRYTYVPLIGLFLAATWGAADLTAGWRRQRLWLSGAAAVVLLACMLLTAKETRAWADTETLFSQALHAQGDNWRAQRIMADGLWRHGRYEEAVQGWRKSLQEQPDDPFAAYDLGTAAAAHGDKATAIAAFGEVLRLRPDRVDVRRQLAGLLMRTGAIRQALLQWQSVLESAPGDLVATNEVAWIFATCPDARYRNGAAAVRIAAEAVQISQNRNPAVLDTLAAAQAEAGQFDKAVQTAQRALSLAGLQGDKTLAAEVQTRLKSYRNDKPWRDERMGAAESGEPK